MRRCLALLLLASAPALACEPAPELAVGCEGCHADGAQGFAPDLYALAEADLAAALEGYATAQPEHPDVMHRLLADLPATTRRRLVAHYRCPPS